MILSVEFSCTFCKIRNTLTVKLIWRHYFYHGTTSRYYISGMCYLPACDCPTTSLEWEYLEYRFGDSLTQWGWRSDFEPLRGIYYWGVLCHSVRFDTERTSVIVSSPGGIITITYLASVRDLGRPRIDFRGRVSLLPANRISLYYYLLVGHDLIVTLPFLIPLLAAIRVTTTRPRKAHYSVARQQLSVLLWDPFLVISRITIEPSVYQNKSTLVSVKVFLKYR